MSRFSSHLSLSCIQYPYIFYRDAFQQQEVRDPPHLFSSFLSSFSIVGADVEILDLKSFEMYRIRCMLSLRYIPRLYRIRFSESALTISYLSYGLSVDIIILSFLRHYPGVIITPPSPTKTTVRPVGANTNTHNIDQDDDDEEFLNLEELPEDVAERISQRTDRTHTQTQSSVTRFRTT